MYQINKTQYRYDFYFSATFDNIDIICLYLEDFLASHNLSDIVFDVVLGARETLNNAVIYGSQKDPSKFVRLNLSLDDSWLVLKTIDPGDGFDFQSKMLECSIESEHGRGLCIINQYFDQVSFVPPGNIVVLKKAVESTGFFGEIYMSEVVKENDTITIHLDTNLVASSIDDIKSEIKRHLSDNTKLLKLDMEKVQYVDSMGLGLLVATRNTMVRSGGVLELTRVSDKIMNLINQMRLQTIFKIT